MTFLPIAERELRARSRRTGTHLSRTAAALFAILVCCAMLLMHGLTRRGQLPGSFMFTTLAAMTFVYCFIEGARNTADCLSEEKREGTLGLLFLTDLKGYDVVLGKFVAASLNSFYGLLAVLPMLGLAILLGGVTAGEFWRMALVLVHTLLFALASGIWISAASRQQGRAWAGTFAVQVAFVGGLLAAGGGLRLGATALGAAQAVGLKNAGPLQDFFTAAGRWVGRGSPVTAFYSAFDSGYWRHEGNFWWSLAFMLMAGLGLLALASQRLPGAWQDAPVRDAPQRWWQRKPRPRTIETAQRAAMRARLMALHPVVWLTLRDDRSRAWVWLLAVLAVGVGSLAWFVPDGLGGVFASWLFWPFQLAFKIWMALQACRFFAEARTSGALELLFVTPLTHREILRGQWTSLRRLFLWPAMAILAGQLLCAVGPFVLSGLSRGDPAFGFMGLMAVYKTVTFATNLLAVAGFGMWLALSVKKPGHAAGLTILLAVLVPMFLFCVPNLAIDLFLILWSMHKLEQHLRARAFVPAGG